MYGVTTLDQIQCPKQLGLMNRPSWAIGNGTSYYRPKISDMILISGYICETIEYQTICDESWLFGNTITHQEDVLNSDNHDCILALERHLSGDTVVPRYPEEECYYAKKYVARNKVIVVTPRNLPYDPYKGVVISNHLYPTECKVMPCMMANKKSIWMMSHNSESYCHQEKPSNMVEVWASGYGDFKQGENPEF